MVQVQLPPLMMRQVFTNSCPGRKREPSGTETSIGLPACTKLQGRFGVEVMVGTSGAENGVLLAVSGTLARVSVGLKIEITGCLVFTASAVTLATEV